MAELVAVLAEASLAEAPSSPPSSPAFDRWNLADGAVDYGVAGKNVSSSPETKPYYITTAINYANGPAHMGHGKHPLLEQHHE